jgi:hypothetical protein
MQGFLIMHAQNLATQLHRFEFDHLPDIWWWDAGTNDPQHISLEPEGEMVCRSWLVGSSPWSAAAETACEAVQVLNQGSCAHSFSLTCCDLGDRLNYRHNAALFKERVGELRRWLLARPESVIAVVAHWGLLHELTGGQDFENCEIRTYELLSSGKLQAVKQAAKASAGRWKWF